MLCRNDECRGFYKETIIVVRREGTRSIPWEIIMLSITTLIGNVTAVALIVLMVGIYVLPTLVAFFRKKRNLLNIAFFNIFLGWTAIAWVIMIVEAFKSDDAP